MYNDFSKESAAVSTSIEIDDQTKNLSWHECALDSIVNKNLY